MEASHPLESFERPHDIADLLLGDQLVTSDQLKIAGQEARERGTSLEVALVALGFISESALAAALAETQGIEHLDLNQVVIDPDLVSQFPQSLAERHKILPLSYENQSLRLAMVDVYDVRALDRVRFLFQEAQQVIPVAVSETDLLEAIDRYYGYEMSVNGVLHEIEKGLPESQAYDGYVNPTVRLVDAIILDGVKGGASDIHFEPEGAFMRLRYRIDGILHQVRTLHSSYWPAMCVRLQAMAGMNIAESRKPQNGRFSIHMGPREIDFRASSHPTVHGENLVLRILDKSRSLLSLENLGYSDSVIGHVKKALEKPEGLFIITGPTGSGKTTSLYSMLSSISTQEVNIMTLEEPVEYRLPLVRQTQIRETLNFVEGVKSILRQDPDILLIGEMRDQDTARMALRAAMTGHQVFTSLHTQDAIGVISRLEDLGLKSRGLAGNISAVIAQRLVRRLCETCKKGYKATPQEAKILKCREGLQLFRSRGCQQCHHKGYKGRMAVAEILPITPQLDDLMSEGVPRSKLKKYLNESGFQRLADEACRVVKAGLSSLSEVQRIVDLWGEA